MDTATSAALGGFTAAEGCFTSSVAAGTGQRRYLFSVGLAAVDAGMCEAFRDHLTVGRIVRSPRRKPHYDDEVTYQVQALPDLVGTIVPFMDLWLPSSHKRKQFLAWRSELLAYWEHSAKRRRACGVEGCDQLSRAHGLCRRHYYEAYGQ
jgi:hypothetical protein